MSAVESTAVLYFSLIDKQKFNECWKFRTQRVCTLHIHKSFVMVFKFSFDSFAVFALAAARRRRTIHGGWFSAGECELEFVAISTKISTSSSPSIQLQIVESVEYCGIYWEWMRKKCRQNCLDSPPWTCLRLGSLCVNSRRELRERYVRCDNKMFESNDDKFSNFRSSCIYVKLREFLQ